MTSGTSKKSPVTMPTTRKQGFRSVLIAEPEFEQLKGIQRDSRSGARFDLSLLVTATLRLVLSKPNAAVAINQQVLLDLNPTSQN